MVSNTAISASGGLHTTFDDRTVDLFSLSDVRCGSISIDRQDVAYWLGISRLYQCYSDMVQMSGRNTRKNYENNDTAVRTCRRYAKYYWKAARLHDPECSSG